MATMTVKEFVTKHPYPHYGGKGDRLEWAEMLLERVAMTPEALLEFYDAAYDKGETQGRYNERVSNLPPIGAPKGWD